MKTAKIHAGITLLTILACLVPQPLSAAGCSVTALDTVAGLGTEVQVTGCAGQSGTQLSVDGPDGAPFEQNVTLNSSGDAVVNVPGKYVEAAGTYTAIFGATRTTFTVLADAPDDAHSTLSASARSAEPGEQITVTAVLRDRYENALSGRPVALLSNRSRDIISSRSSQTDEQGRFTWTVEPDEDGMMTLTAYDVLSSRQLKTRLDIAVGDAGYVSTGSPLAAQMTGMGQGSETGVIDHFEVALTKEGSVNANELFSVVIYAVDATGNRRTQSEEEFQNHIVQGYADTVIIQSSDPDAEFPKKGQNRQQPQLGSVDFRPMDLGVRSIPLGFVFRAGGEQTIEVYDQKDPSIRGKLTVQVNKAPTSASEKITIVSPANNSLIGVREVRVVGKGPVLINIKIKGGVEPVFTETNEDGTFEAQVKLPAEYNEATLFASKEDGTNESDPVRLRIDQTGPKIDSIEFNPAEGRTTDPAVVTVKSEPGLTVLSAKLNQEDIQMVETLSGTYVGNIAAAPAEGQHDFSIEMADEVGNKGSSSAKWNVKRKTLPIVEGVTAEGQANGVAIKWNPVTVGNVTEYRIYIAREEEPENFLASVETNAPVTSAVIKDLEIGYNYLFSLTALNAEGQESAERSEAALGAPLGLLLTARPDDQALVLEWNPPSSIPLAHYMLEYGTEPGVYTERRTINSQLRSFTVRDLLNDVTYEMRLTPVAVTGKSLIELAAVTRGTPSGEAGYRPGAGDPIPDDLYGGAGDPPPDYTVDPPIDDIPSTVGSGPATTMAVGTLVLALLLGIIWRQHRAQKNMTRQFLDMMNQRYHS